MEKKYPETFWRWGFFIFIAALLVIIIINKFSDDTKENNQTIYPIEEEFLVPISLPEPEEDYSDENSNISEINNKYLHFVNPMITFSMKGLDAPERRERMYNALKIVEEAVGEFYFVEINKGNYDEANIKINFPPMDNLRTIGEATPILDGNGNIKGGEITIINIEREGCEDYPATEIHEILHVFGFGHNKKTIMQEYAEGCKPLTSEWSVEYVEHLKFIYSNGERGIEHPEIPYLEFYSFCEEGTYPSTNDPESCCPEPDMWTDKYYCY